MTEPKKIKIEFAPGAFDHFEGTQEELESLIKEIQEELSNMTPEELMARSTPLNIEDLQDMYEEEPEVVEQIIGSLADKRNLQWFHVAQVDTPSRKKAT